METLGLYLQVPFCASKCSFCNFSSRVAPAAVFDAYSRALTDEIERLPEIYDAAGIGRRIFALPVNTIYFGGGTPSLLGTERLERIIRALDERFAFLCHPTPPAVSARSVHLPQPGELEFTLEITPSSADESFLCRAGEIGINRLSIGAQTFEDRELGVIGRLHTVEDTHEQVRAARRAGFTNVSLDLIAGLPYQSRESWEKSLGEALALRPEHISIYLFEIDEESRLGGEVLRHGPRYHAGAVPDEAFMAAAYEAAREALGREGYEQYEISNFAPPGGGSRHNQKYWRLEPYLGLGAGAHSFDGVRRWANDTTVETYQAKLEGGGSPLGGIQTLSPSEQVEEFFFLGLRQREGVDLARARERWGAKEVSRHEPRIAALQDDGWLERRGDALRMTERGYLVSNEIFREFI